VGTYAFKCGDCSEVFDVLAKGYDEAIQNKACVSCGSSNTRRHFSPDSATVSLNQDLEKLSTPTWFKDKVAKINKDLGTNAKTIK